jgi:DNA-binding NtrC family response regulator
MELHHGLVGESPEIVRVRRLIEKASCNRLPVLLLGESGTGKEVVARAIHNACARGQFVPIDCGSLVGTLMESELFGHVKGSFSGAGENKRGLVELADGGTAFFDEIGDLPLEMQVKLLRLIQEREFRPVGGLQWRKVDLRIIAATHRDLKAEVSAGRVRLDLFYRLNVFPIRLPALRDRGGDIPLLIDHFLDPALELPQQILEMLCAYDWPGNVRELKHCIERMTALYSAGNLHPYDLPSAVQNFGLRQLSHSVLQPQGELADARLAPVSPVISVGESELQAIRRALQATDGERSKAAGLLQISRTTLYRRMKQYGMS